MILGIPLLAKYILINSRGRAATTDERGPTKKYFEARSSCDTTTGATKFVLGGNYSPGVLGNLKVVVSPVLGGSESEDQGTFPCVCLLWVRGP